MSWSMKFDRCENRADFQAKVKAEMERMASGDPANDRARAQVTAAARQVLSTLDDMGVELPATEQTPATVATPFFASMNGYAQPTAGPGDSIGTYVSLLGS